MKKHISRLAMVAASLILMICFTVTSASALNLVTNGGFETGDFSGWTKSGSFIEIGTNGINSMYAANLGTYGVLGSLSQSDIMTTPGMEYELSFLLASSGGDQSEFIAAVNGVTLAGGVSSSSFPYTPIYLNFVADVLPTSIELFARNDAGAFSLDNVSVDLAPVPEPSTLLLLGIGLLGASFLRKRIRS